MTTKTYKWQHLVSIPGGHKYFRDEETRRVGVADGSGHTPEYTDDGVLWLDTNRPILIGDRGGTVYASAPVIVDRDSREASTPADLREVLWLVKNLGMSLKIRGYGRDSRYRQTDDFDEQTFKLEAVLPRGD